MIVFFQLDELSDLNESEESQPSSIGYSVKVIDPNSGVARMYMLPGHK